MKAWKKPAIRTLEERDLLKQLSVKAASGPGHTDAHTNQGGDHINAHTNT